MVTLPPPTRSLPAQLARTRRFTLGVPDHFTVTPDGAAVLFLRSRAGDDPVRCLWALDVASGEERLLADPARLLPPGPVTGIEAYATDQAAELVVFALGGGLWTVAVAGGRARCLPAAGSVTGCVTDPLPDPAGRHIAYVSGGALRVIAVDGSGDRALAAPEGPDGGADIAYGTAPHTGLTSPADPRGFWWAPDGERLLVARADFTRVGRWYVSDPADPGTPPRTVRYAAAGMPHAEVTLWLTGLDGSRTEARRDRDAYPYVPGAGWDAHGPYVLVQSRDQRTVRLLGIDPHSGRTRVLSTQRDPHWVHLVPGLPLRTPSGALVSHADLHGTRHLTINGTPVTPPGLHLRAALAPDGDDLLFTASTDPTETHLWSYRPGPGLHRLTTEPGLHSGVRRGGTLVRISDRATRPGVEVAVLREEARGGGEAPGDRVGGGLAPPADQIGRDPAPLAERREDEAAQHTQAAQHAFPVPVPDHPVAGGQGLAPPAANVPAAFPDPITGDQTHAPPAANVPAAFPDPITGDQSHAPPAANVRAVFVACLAEPPVLTARPERLVLGPREVRADLYLPSWHRPGSGRLPVLADPYGGAGRQRVTEGWDWRCLVSQWFAEQGFAVLVADGRGTPGRGPEWEREVHGDLFGPALEDQVTAVHEAARLHPELDLGRVAIRGWSFSGSLAALAVMRRPDVFHAAVAGAGVTDQRLYDAHWRERFLGHPDEHPEAYDAASLLRAAPNLTRPLLLIHGLADTKVLPANTLRLSGELLAAERPHEVLLLPGVGHQAMGSAVTDCLLRHQVNFLRRHLGSVPA
jgi:dipeptidyl-peptidase-4